MSQILRLIISALILLTLFLFAGCSPFVNLPGKRITSPKIEKTHYTTADGVQLPLRSWLPETTPTKAIIIALHGFNDYSNFFTTSGEYLKRYGIACYAYDQRGFGGSPGRGLWAGVGAYTNDLSNFANEIRKLHNDIPIYLLGESMGGAVVIVAMTGNNPPVVDGVILSAPAIWGRDSMPWYQRWLLAVTSHTVPWMELRGKGLHIIPSDNAQMLIALGRDPKVIKATRIDSMYGLTNLMDEALIQGENLKIPTLLLYGKKDQVIPKEPMLQMLKKMPTTTKRAFYENGYHLLLRDLQSEKPLADIVAWINNHDQPLPFGANIWK